MDEGREEPIHKLLKACASGNVQEVEQVLESGVEGLVSQASSKGARNTALHEVVAMGHFALAELLVARGASVSARNKVGATPLHLAAQHAELRAVQMLLDNGANIDATSESLATPLHAAVEGGSLEVVRLLLEKGAQIDARMSQGRTPLHLAAKAGSAALCELLLDLGARITEMTDAGSSALHIAAGVGAEETIHLLVERGCEVDHFEESNGTTPLHLAVTNGHQGAVRALLDREADPNTLTSNGMNALMIACQWAHASIVRLLLQKGVDLEYTDPNGWNCLHTAAYYANEAIVMQLLDFGASPSVRDNRGLLPGESCIAGASQRKKTRIAELLEDVRDREPQGFWRRKIVQQKISSFNEIQSLENDLEEMQQIFCAKENEAQALLSEKEELERKFGDVELQTKLELERSRMEVGQIILESQSRVEQMRQEIINNGSKAEEENRKHIEAKLAAMQKSAELEDSLRAAQEEIERIQQEVENEKKKLKRREEEDKKRLEQAQQEHQQTQEEYERKVEDVEAKMKEMRLDYEKKENAMITWTQQLQTRIDAVGTEKAVLENEFSSLQEKMRGLVQETSSMRTSHAEELSRVREEKAVAEQRLDAETSELTSKMEAMEADFRSKTNEQQAEYSKEMDDLKAKIQTLRNINLHARRQEKEKKAEEERDKMVREAQKSARESLHRAAEAEEALRLANEEIEKLRGLLESLESTSTATLENERKTWQDELARTNGWAKELEAAIELTNSVHERKIAELLQQIDSQKADQSKDEPYNQRPQESTDGAASTPASVNLQLLQVTKEKDDLREQLEQEKLAVKELETEVTSLNEKIEEFEKYSEKMKAFTEELEGAILQKVTRATSEYKAKLEAIEEENGELELENSTLREQLVEARALSQNVRGLESQIHFLKQTEEAHREEMQQLKEVATLATKTLEESEKEVKMLKYEKELKEEEINGLQVKIEALEVDVAASFNQRLRELEGQKASEEEMNQEITELHRKISQLQGKGHGVFQNIGSAFSSKKVKEMEEAIAALEQERDSLQARVDQLEMLDKLDSMDGQYDSDEEPDQRTQLPTILEEEEPGEQDEDLLGIPDEEQLLKEQDRIEANMSKLNEQKHTLKIFALPTGTNLSPANWRPISALTLEEVVKLLQSLQLDKFVGQFKRERVTGKALLSIDEAHLDKFGMRIFLRRAFLQLLDEHRTSGIPYALIEPHRFGGKNNEEECLVM